MKKNKLTGQVIVLTLIRLALNMVFRMVYPFRGEFQQALGVSYAQMSRGLGMRSFLGFFAPLLAGIGERRGRRAGMLFGLAVAAAGLAVVIAWPTFPGFILGLVISTLGKFTYDPTVQAYIGDRVAYERRGRLLAVYEFSWSLAYLLGGLAVGALLARYGWKSPFVLAAGLTLLGMLAVRAMLPDEKEIVRHSSKALGGLQQVLASRPALAALAMIAMMGLANELINLEFGPWLQDKFGLQLLALGGASAVVGLSELGGEGMVSLVIDKLGKPRSVAFGLLLNVLAGGLLPALGGRVAAAVAGLGLFYFSFEFLFVSSVPLLTEILPKARGTMMAFMFAAISLGRLAGAWINPGLHGVGFWASAAASAVANLLALWALSRVRLGEESLNDSDGQG